MDEKELYIKDNEASRAELNEAIQEMMYELRDLDCRKQAHHTGLMNFSKEELSRDKFDALESRVNSLLDVLYGRLYLAECPF